MPSIQDILFPYQKEDVHRLVNEIPRGIIGSEMGTGKTEVFLGTTDLLQANRVLISAPKTMVLEWRDRIKLRLGEDVAVPDGIEDGRYQRYSLDMRHFRSRFLVINHEMLRMERYVKVLEMVPWDIVAFDEAHRLKNRKALQTKGAWALSRKAERLYHISGTPFVNYPDELWSLLFMLYPKEFNNYYKFVEKYCYTIPTPWGPKVVGPNKQNLPELKERLSQLMIRREKKDVLPDLPPKSYREIPLMMDKSQADLYRRMEEEFVIELKNGAKLEAPSSLANLMRLRQIALDPAIINAKAPSSKTAAILDMIDDIPGKVVIFSWFSEYLHYLSELLVKVPHRIITGKNPGERHAAKEAFQNDPNIKLMLASIEAGGEGIDLNSAQVCIFTDIFWTPAKNSQAEDRLHRIGQKGNVLIIHLVHPNTIDDDMHKVNRRKSQVFKETVAREEAIKSMMERYT